MPTQAVSVLSRSQFEVLRMDPEHGPRRAPLPQCWNTHFEVAAPVQKIRSYKGQRNFTGERWTATTADHVGFRSWIERDNLMLLDFETDIVGIAAQPFTLLWRDGRRERKHTPAFFARMADGSGVVVDVYGAVRASARRAEARTALAEACREAGWDLRTPGALEPVYGANVRWLAGYRHPRNALDGVTGQLLAVFAQPAVLFDGAATVGDPIAVLPALYHLMWRQRLRADLHGAVLGPTTVVTRDSRRLR